MNFKYCDLGQPSKRVKGGPLIKFALKILWCARQDPDGIVLCQVKPSCSNRESEVFRMQEQCTRRRQGAEGAEAGVRIAPWRGTSSDAKSGRNVRSTLRPDSRLTFGALGAPDAQGAPGSKYYFC